MARKERSGKKEETVTRERYVKKKKEKEVFHFSTLLFV